MKIAVIGATGHAGSRIVTELLSRGHAVTAVVRHPDRVPAKPGLTPAQGDIHDADGLAARLAGHEVVVSSVLFMATDAPKLIGAVKAAGVGRYLVVGGAGSLEVAPGIALVTTPDFPAAYRSEAEKGRDFLELLRREPVLNWTFLSPSALFTDGERTGTFRLGADQLLVAADGRSWISYEDFAVALADEIERPAHIRRRFTVGY